MIYYNLESLPHKLSYTKKRTYANKECNLDVLTVQPPWIQNAIYTPGQYIIGPS